MKKPSKKNLPPKKRGISKIKAVKKVSSKKFDYESYPVRRLSYVEYVRRHALAHSILDEIED